MYLLIRSTKLAVLAIIAMVMVSGSSKLLAQCSPSYMYGAMGITNFTLKEGSNTIIYRDSWCDISTTAWTAVANGAFNTGVNGNVNLGKTYSYSISGLNYPGYNGTAYSFVYAIWVDLNNDGNFQATERVAVNSSGATAYPTATGTFTLPCTAASGTLKMRVMGNYYYNYNTGQTGWQPDDPCGNYWYGECEDYTLTVQGDMGATFPNSTSPTNILAPGSALTPNKLDRYSISCC